MPRTKKQDTTIKSIENLYAKGGIVSLKEHPRYVDKKYSGRPSIDWVTDGGYPKGRMILIAGEPSSGKSSLSIQMFNNEDKILYVDTEATLTTDYIQALGSNVEKFDHCIPESTEVMCDIIRENIPNYNVIIVDSINNSASEEQISKSAGDRTMANRALVLSAQLPIMIGLCNQYNTTLVVLSQVRDNMNKMNKYDKDKVVPGGNSLHHNSSLTLELTSSTKQKEDSEGGKKKKKKKNLESKKETVYGRLVRIECTKNKTGVPFRSVKVEFTYGKGFTIESDVIASAIRLGIIEQSGSWYSYDDTKIGQGIDNATLTLQENPELFDIVHEKVIEAIKNEKDS